jgi:hypothetical protein
MGMHRTLAVACAVVLVALTPALSAPRVAPDFQLELFNGTTFRLAEARGTAVVLLFWAPW